MARIASGYLIVKSFELLYRTFSRPLRNDRRIYALPHVGVSPEEVAKKYRGIDRDALEPWSQDDLDQGYPNIETPDEREACLAMHKFDPDYANNDFILTYERAQHAYSLLKSPHDWEIIWAAANIAEVERLAGSSLLGYEPTWFWGDHFSAVGDCLCFPHWHGCDEGGSLFAEWYERLNKHALFDSAEDAERYLDYYQTHDWTETGDFVVTEVRLPS